MILILELNRTLKKKKVYLFYINTAYIFHIYIYILNPDLIGPALALMPYPNSSAATQSFLLICFCFWYNVYSGLVY